MKTFNCTKEYSWVRGFAGHPDFGGLPIEVWVTKFDPVRFRYGIRKGKEKFPHFNTMLLDLSYSAWYFDRAAYLHNVDTAFQILKEEKIHTIVRHFNACNSWPPLDCVTPAYLSEMHITVFRKYIKDVLAVLKDKDILMHDIVNEPMNETQGSYKAQMNMYHFVKAMREEIRKVDDRPITVGTQGYWDYEGDYNRQGWEFQPGNVTNDIAFFLPLMDVISLHTYNGEGMSADEWEIYMTKKLEQLEKLGKPVLITECCWAGKDDEARKSILESELPTYKKLGIGFSAHVLLTGKMVDTVPFGDRNEKEEGLYMAFLDENYEIRKYHDIYNKIDE